MGWSVESVVCAGSDSLGTTGGFGHDVTVELVLQYQPEIGGAFLETPLLEWNEKITFQDHSAREQWEFEENMYVNNPNSRTLVIWRQRYRAAYNAVRDDQAPGGYSVLLDKNKMPVTLNAGRAQADPSDQAYDVREYLRSKGGYLRVKFIDRPAIIPRPPQPPLMPPRLSRLLQADCGIQGDTRCRAKWAQYLEVDQSLPRQGWKRHFTKGGWQIVGPGITLPANGMVPPAGYTLAQPRPTCPERAPLLRGRASSIDPVPAFRRRAPSCLHAGRPRNKSFDFLTTFRGPVAHHARAKAANPCHKIINPTASFR